MKRQLKLEKENERIRSSYSQLLEQMQNQEIHAEDQQREFQEVHIAMQAEKEEIADTLQTEKIEAVAHEKRKLNQKIEHLKHINVDLKERLLEAKKAEESLAVLNEELA